MNEQEEKEGVTLAPEIKPTEEQIEAPKSESQDDSDNSDKIDTPVSTEQSGTPTPEPEANRNDPLPPKTFTQEQLDEIVGRTRSEARNRAVQELYGKYGVANGEELDDLFGKAQSYQVLQDEFGNVKTQNKDILAENALLKSGIAENRWDDAKAILASKNLEVNYDNIIQELDTHPEWKGNTKTITMSDAENMMINSQKMNQDNPSLLKRMGNDIPTTEKESEEDIMKRLFFNAERRI